MDAGTPIDFYRQGTRGAYASCAASADSWQAIGICCPSCDARYLASVARRHPEHDSTSVRAYADLTGQTLLAARHLGEECPDHGFRVRVRAFHVV